MENYNVVAFDPGGRTGWAVFCIAGEAMYLPEYLITPNILFWNAGEFSGTINSQVEEMANMANEWDEEGTDIVCEDFLLRSFLPGREVLDPVRINAAFEFAIRPRRVNYQMPATGLGTVTEDHLRDMGYYSHHLLVGRKDARSAVQHALAWAKRRRASNLKNASLNGARPRE